jgi:flagellar motor switch protein FliM
MVGSRKLSNDEVEALLGGLDAAGKQEDTPAVFDTTAVREFDFGSEDLSLLGDYYALRMVNEKICRFTRFSIFANVANYASDLVVSSGSEIV